MNTISAAKLVTGYEEAQQVIARAGSYSLVLKKRQRASGQGTSGMRLPVFRESGLEKRLLILLGGAALLSILLGLADSLHFAANWEAFHNGIAVLLKP